MTDRRHERRQSDQRGDGEHVVQQRRGGGGGEMLHAVQRAGQQRRETNQHQIRKRDPRQIDRQREFVRIFGEARRKHVHDLRHEDLAQDRQPAQPERHHRDRFLSETTRRVRSLDRQQSGEFRDERGVERAFTKQPAEQIGQFVGHEERVGDRTGADQVRHQHVAQKAEHPADHGPAADGHHALQHRRPPSPDGRRRQCRVAVHVTGRIGQSAQGETLPPARRRVGQPQIRHAAEQRGEHHLGLDPRQLRADAKMDAAAERQRLQPFPCDVQPVGIGKHLRIAIGGADQCHDQVAFRECFGSEHDRLRHRAGDRLYRALEPQDFLDRVRDQRRIVAHRRPLVRSAKQRPDPVADQVDRRFMAGGEQQRRIGAQFLGGQMIAGFFRLDQQGQQIVARVAPPLLEQRLEIRPRRQRALIGAIEFFPGRRHRVQQSGARRGRGHEPRAIRLRDAQKFAYHQHGQGKRQIADRVHRAGRRDLIQQPVGDRLNARTHVLDLARGEHLGDQTTQPRVVRRIAHQHHVRQLDHRRLSHRGRAEPADQCLGVGIILAQSPVAQQERGVFVSRKKRPPERGAPDRRAFPQRAKRRIRIGDERRIARVEPDHGNGLLARATIASNST